MNFENAFLGPRFIQMCHLRSKTPLTSVDRLRGPPRPIQRGRWPLCVPRRRRKSRPPPPWPCTDPAVAAMATTHSSSPPWPCAQQLPAAARRDATAADEGEGKGGGSCRTSLESRPPPGVRAVPPELWEPLGSAPSRALPTPGLELAHRPDNADGTGPRRARRRLSPPPSSRAPPAAPALPPLRRLPPPWPLIVPPARHRAWIRPVSRSMNGR